MPGCRPIIADRWKNTIHEPVSHTWSDKYGFTKPMKKCKPSLENQMERDEKNENMIFYTYKHVRRLKKKKGEKEIKGWGQEERTNKSRKLVIKQASN